MGYLQSEEMEIIRELSVMDLADFAEQLLQEKRRIFEQFDFVSQVLIKKMEEDEAKKVVTPAVSVSIDYTKSYDQDKLRELFSVNELIEQRLIDNGGYIPEQDVTVTVPQKFNMTKVNALGKEGKTNQDIIDSAEILHERKARLKITRIGAI